MNLQPLFESQYRVMAIVVGGSCPVDDFLSDLSDTTQLARMAISSWLESIAETGLHAAPVAWYKVANRENGIYEFKKGDIRVFFFKGKSNEVVVCTCGVVKKGQKADPQAVQASIRAKNKYFNSK